MLETIRQINVLFTLKLNVIDTISTKKLVVSYNQEKKETNKKELSKSLHPFESFI